VALGSQDETGIEEAVPELEMLDTSHNNPEMDIRIAQYNVHKRKNTMILLSADKQTVTYDVLAIQEPARNPNMHATYCDPKSTFRPLYPTNRACFLINKRL